MFSAVFLPDPCSLLKEARDFPAACRFFFLCFFLSTHRHTRFFLYDQPITLTLKPPIPLNISENIKGHTLQRRPEFKWEPLRSERHLLSFPPLFSRGLVSAPQSRRRGIASTQGGKRGAGGVGGGSFSSSVCVHHVSWPLLAFMFCLAESPAPAVSVSSLQICVPERQETPSPASISARLSVAARARLSPC